MDREWLNLMTSTDEIGKAVTAEAVTCLRYGVEKIEHCLGQLDDDQIWWRPNEEMNAIGNLLLHLAGNLGQWIVAGIGDTEYKRDRPAEFSERRKRSKDEVLKTLLDAVEKSCATLTAVSADELLAVNRIQGSDVSKMNAMMHSVTHFQGHVQEIIGLTRQTLGIEYRLQWTPQTAEEGAPKPSLEDSAD
ncbi:MAG TPA: DUF1572 domain-containing protein [Planctomycetaceae bacterium]|nr:DUF1572 domain-containing protein [Planctomycetaceae bacterium]